MKKFYITTPIYYVNDVPHIGHAYTTIAADVLARYYKKKLGPDKVFFLTGTDEHGAKIAEAARRAGKEPREYVDELAPKFQKTWENLNIEYSEFFRTTNPLHEEAVQNFVQCLMNNGYVEKRSYEGLYCISCERYYKEEELVEGKCPDHKRELVKQSEDNYFFLLSKPEISEQLLAKIENGELKIGPESRKNEVVSKIKLGLEDVSISRAGVKWGIPFPGDPDQTIYVWVDALLNYFTAEKIYFKNGQPTDGPTDNEQASPVLWPADLHLMAKDILWFHAVIWPAMLIAAGEETPKKVFAHGFFTINGTKMSKTLGNVIDPNEAVTKFGADVVRYSLLREFPFGEDGDISLEKMQGRYQELGNNIGNLFQRTISMINKYDTKVTKTENKDEYDYGLVDMVDNVVDELRFDMVLASIDSYATMCNTYINEHKPWVLAVSDPELLTKVLNRVFNNLYSIVLALEPFMPETAKKMNTQLETLRPEPLFPRLES
ncbi:MAG: methionine--tRNA ligase [Patescibacteria group bacterium]|jgi:methionyl-tRNA synthetase